MPAPTLSRSERHVCTVPRLILRMAVQDGGVPPKHTNELSGSSHKHGERKEGSSAQNSALRERLRWPDQGPRQRRNTRRKFWGVRIDAWESSCMPPRRAVPSTSWCVVDPCGPRPKRLPERKLDEVPLDTLGRLLLESITADAVPHPCSSSKRFKRQPSSPSARADL